MLKSKSFMFYSKNNIGLPSEAAKWKNVITQYYEEFKKLK